MQLLEILKERTMHVEIGSLVFVWDGGSYIDILLRNANDTVDYTDCCINVWDYSEGKATIPFGDYEILIQECLDYLKTQRQACG